MSPATKICVIFLVGITGLWGCAQGPGAGPEKIKSLESKLTRLEEDYKIATESRDQAKKKIATLEMEKKQLTQQLDEQCQLAKERTSQRDTVQTQYDQFRANIKSLLGQAEAALNGPAVGPAVAADAPTPSKTPEIKQ